MPHTPDPMIRHQPKACRCAYLHDQFRHGERCSDVRSDGVIFPANVEGRSDGMGSYPEEGVRKEVDEK